MLDQCCMMDLGLVGGYFTWVKNRDGGGRICKWLDHRLGDCDWRTLVLEAYVEVLGRFHSNYHPLFLCCGRIPPPPSNYPFRHQAMWETHLEFPRVVNDVWKGCSMGVTTKLHEVQNNKRSLAKKRCDILGPVLDTLTDIQFPLCTFSIISKGNFLCKEQKSMETKGPPREDPW